ncbi:MAG: hypothetical protein R2834_01725 [Rhodothermales bacterium]
MPTLTHPILLDAVNELADRDPALAGIVQTWGPPPLWDRPEGFPTLVHIILEQQVSLASARAAFDRLDETLGGVDPEGMLRLDDAALLRIGFSRQKARYGRLLARAVLDGDLDLVALPALADDEVRRRLTAITGIGPWTADIYLLMALRRPDVWPQGDLALAVAMQRVLGLPQRPSRQEQLERSEAWAPWRAVAARLLWHQYLSDRRRPV